MLVLREMRRGSDLPKGRGLSDKGAGDLQQSPRAVTGASFTAGQGGKAVVSRPLGSHEGQAFPHRGLQLGKAFSSQ